MNEERWELLESALGPALEGPPEERHDVLRRACGDDSELLAEAEVLLASEEEPGAFDLLFAAFAGEQPGVVPEGLRAGDPLGPYRIERLVGRGGMGAVYLAHRSDGQFEQRVAIKVLRADSLAPASRRRFLIERQTMARLTHPSIARVFDGGVTAQGGPYLVMEYVEGTPIDAFCDDRRLTVAERLSLFIRVCDAVHFAHQNLVIHRDLKPGNILVTDQGYPKLLDFGVAKLLSDEDGDETLTRTGWLPMTPEYASPEQVRGEPVTTASDVYALGGILYGLLTGHRPYRFDRLVPSEVERVVCEVEPLPPSVAVDSVEEVETKRRGEAIRITPDLVSHLRSSTLPGLRRSLRGDLDTIVLKALRKTPARRYAGAGELAADIGRHLAGRPVRARPDTRSYRLSKFVRRHRTGVATSMTIAAALVGFAATMTIQADRVARERDHAERVTQLLGDVFASADPAAVPGEELTVREALDQGVRGLRERLGDAGEVQARLLDVIARSYHSVGALDRAIGLQEDAVAQLRAAVPRKHPLFLRALRDLGQWQSEAGNTEEAQVLLREALGIARRLGSRRAAELAATLNDHGVVLQEAGDHAAARPLYEEALVIYRTMPDPPPSVEHTLANLGWIAHSGGDWATAEARFREVLERRRARLGAEHPLTGVSMAALSDVLARQDRLLEAGTLATEALTIARANYPEAHPRLASALSASADLLGLQGRFPEAEALQREALAMYRELFGDDHATIAYATNDLAKQLREQGRLEEAATLYREAVDRFARPLGSSHPFTAVVRTNLAWTEHLRGQDVKAEAIYRRAVPILDSAWAGTPAIASTLVDFGVVLATRGKCREAEPLLRRALQQERGRWPPEHERVVRPQRQLGTCLANLRRFDEAESLLLDTYRTVIEVGRPTGAVVDIARELVRLYELWDRQELAARYRGAAVAGR